MAQRREGGSGLHLHRSNRVEVLRDELVALVARAPADPFDRECIVVQGRGMESWLAQQLASALSVWANAEFPFPRPLLERALAALPDAPAGRVDPFAPENLLWTIADLLPAELAGPVFAPVRNYLEGLAREGDSRGDRCIALARRLADLFDHYVVYRPELLLAWERGEPGARESGAGAADADLRWQAELWRRVVQRLGSLHLAARARRLIAALGRGELELSQLPARISVFGISTLPPLFVSLFHAISRQREVHLFVLAPSREYWADLRSPREMPSQTVGADESAEGHPLLLSLGRLGREFQQLLEERAPEQLEGRDLFCDPCAPDTLESSPRALQVLQSDMLALRRRGIGAEPAMRLAPGDDSIRVHCCYGPMREAQALRDDLIDLFERHPDLEPRDVVVMTPDVEACAPYLEAVFAEPLAAGSGSGIPCQVSDRNALAAHVALAAFGQLLDVLAGRLEASALLDLIALPAIGERFEIGPDECVRLREWLNEAAVRWGRDAEHRRALDQPEVVENTWRFGLDRLLLGYASPDGERRLFAGRLPCGPIEGADAALLGRFIEFCELLFEFQKQLDRPRSVREWSEDLCLLANRTLAEGPEQARARLLVQTALRELAEAARQAEFRGALSLEALRELLESGLRQRVHSGGFATGGVTICELVPMRSVPFRVVCLLGMNDEDFPRIRHPLGFDLMARRRAAGDRSSRDDDRHLFLEALLSARDWLRVSYTGRAARDGSTRPPSVVVGELLDALSESFRVEADGAGAAAPDRPGAASAEGSQAGVSSKRTSGGIECQREAVLQQIVVEHPLQPFSPRYFGAGQDSRLFSYSHHDCEGARALLGEKRRPALFVNEPLPAREAESERAGGEAGGPIVTLEALRRFFRHPQRTLLRERLDLFLEQSDDAYEDREPIRLQDLARWKLGQELLERAEAGEPIERDFERVRATGRLPLGAPACSVYLDLCREVRALRARAEALRSGHVLPEVEIDLALAGVHLQGRLGDLWPSGRVRLQFARLGSASEFDVWLEHLVLICASPADMQAAGTRSYLIGRSTGKTGKSIVRFGPVPEADRHLETLVALCRVGLECALPFFPKTSRRYVESLLSRSRKKAPENDREAQAIKNAYQAFRGDENKRGEMREKIDLQQVFGAVDPLADGFAVPLADAGGLGFRDVARRVYAPLLGHREEISG